VEPSRDSPLLPLILRHGLLRLHRCSCLSRVVPSKQCREGLRYRFVCGYCLWLLFVVKVMVVVERDFVRGMEKKMRDGDKESERKESEDTRVRRERETNTSFSMHFCPLDVS